MIKSLNGLNLKEITLYAEENVKPGMTVVITDKYTVGVATKNAKFFGICTDVKGGYATVAVSGIITVPFSGTDITIGYNFISADGNGNVKYDAGGSVEYLVFDIDEENNLVTISLDK